MIAFQCSHCGKPLSVKDEFAGKRGTCPHCKQPMQVPSAPTVADARALPPSETLAGEPLAFLAPKQQPDELGRLGPYRILKVLGSGGMGMVLQAEDPTLKRAVALKIMRPELAANSLQRQRFLREAQATAAIEHDHIVAIHQVGEAGDVPFIAMPFLKGEPLDARLKREGQLPIAEAVRIGREMAEGLAAAHERGLIHRDIKPGNVWLEAPKGRVKIVDFGLARSGDDDVQLTKTGTILGTPAFMAPEQAAARAVDARCDLYSLGAVLYRMLTGRLPFSGPDTMALLLALATETPKPVRELNAAVPAALNALVMQLLAKESGQRPASAQAVAAALGAIAGEPTPLLDGRAGGVSPLLKAAPIAARYQQGANAPRSPGRVLLAVMLFLLRQVWRLYCLPGRLGWVIRGGTLLVLLVVGVLWLTRPGPAPTESSLGPTPAPPGPSEPERIYVVPSLGLKMVRVPHGKFLMGGGGGNPGTTEVEIKYDFYLGQYAVTQWEWRQMMGKNPSAFRSDPSAKPLSPEERLKLTPEVLEKAERAQEAYWKRMPVENVSWDDCQEFVKKLNEKEKSAEWLYRLPTEVEWEYACRGAPVFEKTPLYYYGFDFYLLKPTNTLLPDQANFKWGDKALGRTCPVGSYEPNPLGLYDMHGNVRQWCQDEVKDDKGGSDRVLRGGCWNSNGDLCRAAYRYRITPSVRLYSIGFRLARVSVGVK